MWNSNGVSQAAESSDKAGITEKALCSVFTGHVSPWISQTGTDESSRELAIWLPHGSKQAWNCLSLGVVGSVWVMHRTAEIQQHSLRWTQKTNKITRGTKRCLKQLQCHARKIQNKVIKGKLICLEDCSRIIGFLCRNLLPEESCQFWNMPSFKKIAFWGNFLTWSVWVVGFFHVHILWFICNTEIKSPWELHTHSSLGKTLSYKVFFFF